MPWHVAPRLRPSRARVPSGLLFSGLLFATLAIALAPPAVGVASSKSPKKPVSVPDCFNFPAHKLAQLLHETGSFRFDGGTFTPPGESICTWITRPVPGRYRDILQITVPASNLAEFKQFERIAKQDAARTGAHFHTYHADGAPGFVENQFFESTHLAPCKPPNPPPPLPAFGPPACFPQPEWVSTHVVSYGALKPRGPKAMVNVGFDAEYQGGQAITYVQDVNRAILSGQLR